MKNLAVRDAATAQILLSQKEALSLMRRALTNKGDLSSVATALDHLTSRMELSLDNPSLKPNSDALKTTVYASRLLLTSPDYAPKGLAALTSALKCSALNPVMRENISQTILSSECFLKNDLRVCALEIVERSAPLDLSAYRVAKEKLKQIETQATQADRTRESFAGTLQTNQLVALSL